jgi:hypothetical protein
MFRKLSILALAALVSVATSAAVTERELPTKTNTKYNKNAKRVKFFEVCTNDGRSLLLRMSLASSCLKGVESVGIKRVEYL